MQKNRILKLLNDLKFDADLRSNELMRMGRRVSDVERAKSSGCADAYLMCIGLIEGKYDPFSGRNKKH